MWQAFDAEMDDDLTPVERGILFALMAEGGPLNENSDLIVRLQIGMTKKHRERLQSKGLIKTTPSPFRHELTKAGWAWASTEVKNQPPKGQMKLGALYAVLNGIARQLVRRKYSVEEFFAPPSSESPDGEQPTNSSPNHEATYQRAIADAAWSDSEEVLAFALQNLPSFERNVRKLEGIVGNEVKAEVQQVELSAQAIFQHLRLAADKRGLVAVGQRDEVRPFDGAFFVSGTDAADGEKIKVKKQPIVKRRPEGEIVVARGVAEPFVE